MAVHLATFSDESVPVALGVVLAWSGDPSPDLSVYLVAHDPGGHQRESKDISYRLTLLKRWLHARRRTCQLITDHLGQLGEVARRIEELADNDQPSIVNITGGTKALSIAALEGALRALAKQRKVTVLTFNPHDPSGLSTYYVENASEGDGPQPLTERLSSEEYVRLHVDLDGVNGRYRARAATEADPWATPFSLIVEIRGKHWAVAEQAGRLYVLPEGSQRWTSQMLRHLYLARQLGGSLAVPIYRLETGATNDKHVQRARALEGAVLLPGEKPDDAIRGYLAGRTAGVSGPVPTDVKPPSGKEVLVCLVGEQPMPALVSCCGRRWSQVYLLASRQLPLAARRLSRWVEGKGVPVQVLLDLDPAEPKAAGTAIRSILDRCSGANVRLNINGGTTAMVAEAYRAARDADGMVLEYVHGDRITEIVPRRLTEKGAGPVRLTADLDEVLALHGVKFHKVPNTRVSRIDELYEAACRYQAQRTRPATHSPQGSEIALAAGVDRGDFRRLWQRYFPSHPCPTGRALEYIVYCDLERSLARRPAAEAVCMPGGWTLKRLRWDERTEREEPAHDACDADVVVLCRGQLLLVEAKQSLATALSDDNVEDVVQFVRSQSFGGHYAKALIVAEEEGDLTDYGADLEGWAGSRNPAFAVRGTVTRPDLVYKFPGDLRKLFRDWGWLGT